MVCFGSGCGSSRSLSKCWKKQNFRRKTAVLALYLSTVKYMFSCRLMARGQGFHFCATYTEWSRCKMVRARVRTHTLAREWGKWRERKRERERERGAGWRCVVRGSDFCRDRGGGGRGRRQGRKGRGKKKFRVFFYEVKHQIYKDPGGQNFRPFALLYEIKLKFVQQQQQSLVGRRGIQGKGRNRAGKLLVKVAHTFLGGHGAVSACCASAIARMKSVRKLIMCLICGDT